MKPSEASKKLEFHSKQICHGCVHPSMVGWCENHCQLPEAFEMAISALEKQEKDRWIPVTERLPEKEGCYLVTVKNDHERRYSKTAWYSGDGWFARQDIIAWRLTPEPYKVEKEA